tara:strand:- start:1926 stop:2324 length:399 start_codon:yes stop_codon:yes gene_type:complete
MVWSQYVDEATIGFDAYVTDDDEFNNEHTPLNIEDWEVEYSDELHMMWNTMNTLLYDAHIEHTGKFCDFVEFCYVEHDDCHECAKTLYEDELYYIWKDLRRIVNDNGLHEEMMRGSTFDHFGDFVEKYLGVY